MVRLRSVSRSYNTIAGQNVARLGSLSDGVFSIAMTLMVLDLRAPAQEAIRSESDLIAAMGALAPRVAMYVISFMTMGIFWVGQQTQLNHLIRSSRGLSWIHLAFLFGVSVAPFSTSLLAQFATYRTALLVYWFNIFFLGAMLYASWKKALAEGLVRQDLPADVSDAIRRRIVVAQAIYAGGAALCFVHPYWSLAVFLTVQAAYALGLNLPARFRR